MTQRDALLVLVSVVLATGIAAILLVGSISAATPGVQRPQFVFQGRGGPPPGQIGEAQRRVPEAIRPIVPVERGVADAARGAAGYLLSLLAVSATVLLAREQVLSSYRASLGDWRQQLRTLGTGLAVLLLVSSALFLASIVFVGALTSGPFPAFGPPPGPGAPSLGIQFGLQAGFVLFSIIVVLTALPALVGFAATSWRLGDSVFALGPLARWGAQVPRPLVALLGATIIYLSAQVPFIGIVAGVGALAYALGAFVIARLDSGAATAP